jgi:hypothetical protein
MNYAFVPGELVEICLGSGHYLSGLIGTITDRDRNVSGGCTYRVQFYEEVVAPDGSLLSSEEFDEANLQLQSETSLRPRELRTHQSIQLRVGYKRPEDRIIRGERLNLSSIETPICTCERLLYGHNETCPYLLSNRR